MKAKGTHEDCIEQMVRLFNDRIYSDDLLDSAGRIRVDDWEMESDVQQSVADIWSNISTETLYPVRTTPVTRKTSLNLFGFELPGVIMMRMLKSNWIFLV